MKGILRTNKRVNEPQKSLDECEQPNLKVTQWTHLSRFATEIPR